MGRACQTLLLDKKFNLHAVLYKARLLPYQISAPALLQHLYSALSTTTIDVDDILY